jgi:hypothetical protein
MFLGRLLSAFMVPNCGLPKVALGGEKPGQLETLNSSVRNCTLSRSLNPVFFVRCQTYLIRSVAPAAVKGAGRRPEREGGGWKGCRYRAVSASDRA